MTLSVYASISIYFDIFKILEGQIIIPPSPPVQHTNAYVCIYTYINIYIIALLEFRQKSYVIVFSSEI